MNCFKQFSNFLRYERRLNGSDQSSCHGDRGRHAGFIYEICPAGIQFDDQYKCRYFIFGFALICLQKITGSIQTLGEYLAVSPVYIRILLRITGIAYICDFASCICKDAGYQAIAAQIELLGKLTIIVMSLPVLQTLMSAITEFIGA